jgi:uncharacterized membrane protein
MSPRIRVSLSLVVWALILAYAVFFSAASIQKHQAFQTTDFDLGNLSQVVWNTLHGHPFLLTNPEGAQPEMSLGIHVWLILLPLSPLYLVWADPRLLLIVQSVVIALGAWPVYLLANGQMSKGANESRRSTSTSALTFVLAYLLFPALQSANMFDFHPLALAPTLLLAAFYALERERWGWLALWAGLAMACQEDVALMVALMGLYAALIRRHWRAGLLVFAASVAWFAVAVGVILPHFDTAGASPFASRYGYLGDTPWQMAGMMLTRPGVVLDALWTPEKLAYLRDLLTPTGFLSLLAPQVLVFSLPPVLTNLLSTKDLMHELEGFHYSINAVPFVVVSAAYGAAWLAERFRRRRAWVRAGLAALVLVCSLLYHLGHGYTPLGANFRWSEVTEHDRLGEQMARRIPANASLSALPYLHPHASNRALMYAVNRVEDGHLARVDGVDYVWLDVTNSWPIHPNDLKRGIEDLLAGDYGVDQATDGWLLLRRGALAKTLPDEFYTFARAADPQPRYPMQLQFLLDGQPILECLGFDLHRQPAYNLQPTTDSLTLYWRALHPLPADLRLYPFYFDDATGEILEDTSQRPLIATLWYPPERWPVGEIVQASTMPWDVGDKFSVGLGVVQGGDWGDVGARLPLRVESSDLVVRLFDGDTWARLLHVADGQPEQEYRQFTAPAPQHLLHADFDNQILLLGYDLDHAPRTTQYAIRLHWQAQQRMDTSYTVFAQLLGPAGNVRAQVDRVPQDGGYPTPWWLPGEVVVDDFTLDLPPDAPRDAAYRLIVGLYDPRTGERLPVLGSGADFVELATLQP